MDRLLTKDERKLFQKLDSPQKIQDFLDKLPINFELNGETYMSPRRVIRERTAHCLEGALLACAAIAYHGGKPLILDIQTIAEDDDHVVALFKQHGRWGAISKTNHAILRYRDPVYLTPRELAMSYFHEYFLWPGKKTMRAYSKPFNMNQYKLEEWLTPEEDLNWLAQVIDDSEHFPVAERKNLRVLRNAGKVEYNVMLKTEWNESGKKTTSRASN